MRHRFPSIRRPRGALLFLALLSAVVFSGVQSASCDMHGLGGMRGERPGMRSHHTDLSTAATQADPAHQHGQSNEGTEEGCHCTCIGACTMVAQPATVPATVTLRVALVAPEPNRALDPTPTRAPPAAPDRRLPFANGPPDSALA